MLVRTWLRMCVHRIFIQQVPVIALFHESHATSQNHRMEVVLHVHNRKHVVSL